MRKTLTAVFRHPEAALRAAELVRDLDGAASSVRLFLPGDDGAPVELRVVRQRSALPRVALFGLTVGVLFLYVALSLSGSWLYGAVALVCGGFFGLVLGSWLGGGERPRPVRPHMRARYLELVRRGHGVIVVDTVGAPEDVRQLMEEAGAYVSEGHWPVRDALQPV